MTELLKDLIEIPEHVHKGDFVLKLTEGISEDHAERTLRDYVVTEQLLDCFDQALRLIQSALTSPPTSKAVYLHGSFGSGKSHFMAVLHLLLRGDPAARKHAKLHPLLARHDAWLDGKRFLLVPYHMIDAHSVESAVLGGYVEHVRKLHPNAPLPAVYQADGLVTDAEQLRATMGDDAFFAKLNAVRDTDDDGWGDMSAAWDAARFAEAASAPPRSELRGELISDLIDGIFTSYRGLAAGDEEKLVDLDEGLGALSRHAKSLGYDGLILFLDELVLWLATRMTDREFVTREGNKVVKLVEATRAERPVPIVSFVARQRDLRELVGEATPGAEHLVFADVLRHAEGRFGQITLEDRNLPAIASERVLRPKDGAARQRIEEAFARSSKVRSDIRDILLTGQADMGLFRQVYPFSPAFIQTLVAVSSALQRERTALKMLAIYLRDHRETLELGQLIPVGDLFDLISEGDEPFSQDMRLHFESARRLWVQRLRPMLERRHGLAWADADPENPKTPGLRNDARLLKTLLLGALVPEVESLKNLNANRLAALNHGTIRTRIPGQERSMVLKKVREWAGEVGEIKVGDDPGDPSIGLQLTGVDTEAILEKAKIHDNTGNQQRMLRRLLFEQLGIALNDDLYQRHELVWKGTRREFDVLFGNVRELVFDSLRSRDGVWKVVIDFPFDEPGHGVGDDRERLEQFRATEEAQEALVWLPHFLGPDARRELGKLVVLDHVLTGDRFDGYATHLSPAERSTARLILENQQTQLRQSLINLLLAAYGVERNESRMDPANLVERHIESLDPGFEPRTPVGANLGEAFRNLLGQALSYQFPQHPDFGDGDGEVRASQAKKVAEELLRVIEQGNQGRLDVEDKKLRPLLRRIAQPLELGTMHETAFQFSKDWPTHVDRQLSLKKQQGGSDELTVGRIREWTDLPERRGLPEWAQDLVTLAVAADMQRTFYLNGRACTPELGALDPAMVLVQERLPDEATWETARKRASAVLGLTPTRFLSARTVATLSSQLKAEFEPLLESAESLSGELREAAKTLGVEGGFDRLETARVGLALAQATVGAKDRARVKCFAEFDVEERSLEALARSLKQASAVIAALKRANWDLLKGAFERPEGESIQRMLLDALRDDELVKSLVPALREAEADATRLLIQPEGPRTPPPRRDKPRSRPEERADALDAEGAAALFERLLGSLRDDSGKRLSVSWRFDEGSP